MFMKKLLIIVMYVLSYHPLFAGDTPWLGKKWQPVIRETASYYNIYSKKGNLVQQRMFYNNNGQLYMQGTYVDSLGRLVKNGVFKSFSENGILTDSVVYQNGIPVSMAILHKNGKLKTLLLRNEKSIATYVNSWDDRGNESYLDTFYHDNRGRDCHKDTAYLKGIINKEDSIWKLRFYLADNGSLHSVAYYKERLCKTRVKFGCWYQQGILKDSIIFTDKGKRNEAWYFHSNGILNAHHRYDSTGKISFAENKDEQGNSIKADTLSIHAMPAEGYKAWEKRLMKKMNNDNSIDWKYRKDLYSSVYIQFAIDADGNLVATAIKEASLYPEMDTLILNACKETVRWKPCTIHGRKSTCSRVKCFSYVAGVVL